MGSSSGPTGCAAKSHTLLTNALAAPEQHFAKSLKHTLVDGAAVPADYQEFVDGLISINTNAPSDGPLPLPMPLSIVPQGSTNPRRWINPLAGWSTDTEVTDPCCYEIPSPPAIDTPEEAWEMIELYWMALLRDVPFINWESHPEVLEAANELSNKPLYINLANVNDAPVGLNGFQGLPLSPKSVFRGGELGRATAGANLPVNEAVGPYISQFLCQPFRYGTLRVSQSVVRAVEGLDFMTTWAEYVAVQNGEQRYDKQGLVGDQNEGDRRYIATMRDLATYVHFDQLYEAYLNAALILLGGGYGLDEGNPYSSVCAPTGSGVGAGTGKQDYLTADGFGTFGGAHLLSLVTEAATRALKTVWRQKWTHLRLRPEAYGALVHRALHGTSAGTGAGNDAPQIFNGLGPAQTIIDASNAIELIQLRAAGRHGQPNALLPMAFPEGSPTHPSYGAGHATVAGACVTILKAFFNESQPIHDAVQASEDGHTLLPYTGVDAGKLTVGLELEKLAANIAIGRNMGGVHWRSDYTQSLLLGQRVAIDILWRQSRTYREQYCWHLSTFCGNAVRVDHDGVTQNAIPILGAFAGEAITDCTVADRLKMIC